MITLIIPAAIGMPCSRRMALLLQYAKSAYGVQGDTQHEAGCYHEKYSY